MNTADVSLRPARADEADEAAPLIYAAGPTLFGLMFGPSPAAVIRLFARLFRRQNNPFSYEHAVVAVQNDVLVGIALAGTITTRRAGQGRMLFLLPILHSPLALIRALPRLRDIAACTSPPPVGAYYLSILAVAERERSRGIGTRLLTQICHDAARAGGKCVVLHAETGNARAQAFYRRHGFTATAEHAAAPKLIAAGVTGLTMMRRDLT